MLALTALLLAASKALACSYCSNGPSSHVGGDSQVVPAPLRLANSVAPNTVLNGSSLTLKPYSVPKADSTLTASSAASSFLYTVDTNGSIVSSDKQCLAAQGNAVAFADCASTSVAFLKFDASVKSASGAFTGAIKTPSGDCLLDSVTVGASAACPSWTVDYQYAPISNGNGKSIRVDTTAGAVTAGVVGASNLAIDSQGNIFAAVEGSDDVCLGANSIAAGAPVIIASCSAGLSVSFFAKTSGQLMVSTTNKKKVLCLDTAANGLSLVLQTCSDKASQKWSL
ncbi:hypothetical protein HDU77_006591 [Chytriomyces hyalinus]|nr:hypothetical protein HDU77_006591 [Chytriomyces hyalinus]